MTTSYRVRHKQFREVRLVFVVDEAARTIRLEWEKEPAEDPDAVGYVESLKELLALDVEDDAAYIGRWPHRIVFPFVRQNMLRLVDKLPELAPRPEEIN